MMDIKDVIITGGQGFIGSWVAKLLVESNQYNVVVLDVKPDLHILAQVLTKEQLEKVKLVYIDITDTQLVTSLILKHQPQFIVHLAGLQIPTCRANPILGANVNVIGTLNVFEGVKQLKDKNNLICPIIYASSAAVSGPSEDYDGPITDSAHHTPLTHYGVFKQANEGSARVYWMDHKIPSVGLRPFTVYGVGREVGVTSSPTKLLKCLVFGRQNYTVPFSGKLCVNYVEDIARLFFDLGRLKFQGAHVCNIKGDVLDVKEWVELVKKQDPTAKIEIKVEGGSLPFPTDFTEETLEKLLNGKIITTPPEKGIQNTFNLFKKLYHDGLLDDKDL